MIGSITEFFTEPIGIVTIFSFLAGIFGYIIAKYWIRPIARYRRIKREISRHIKKISAEITESGSSGNTDTVPETCARLSARLNDSYHTDLPPWYRISLGRKKETPPEAAKDLMTLSKTRNTEHVRNRLRQIALHLHIRQ